MATINLLPWRKQRRAKRQREFIKWLLIWLCLSLAIAVYWYWYQLGLIEHQKQRNHYLQQQLNLVSVDIGKINQLEKQQQSLVARMQVVNNLQTHRPQVVHLFDELVSTLPKGVQLTELSQAENTITVSGRAESNTRISDFMRQIESSLWLTNPVLQVVEQKPSRGSSSITGIHHFSLSMQQVLPSSEATE